MEELYEYNGQKYTREQLAQRYGDDKVDSAIKELGMKVIPMNKPKPSAPVEEKLYEYKGAKYSQSQLEQRYPGKVDEAVKKLGMMEVNAPEEVKPEPVKKKDNSDSISPDQNLDAPTIPEETNTSSDTKDVPWTTDFWNALKSGVASTAAGVAGIKNFNDKFTYSVFTKHFLSDKNKELIDSLPAEEREEAISRIVNLDPVNEAIGKFSIDTQNKLTEASKEYESKMQEFEGNIVDDFTSGNVGQGLYRAFRGATQSSSSIALAVVPGGIAVIGAGTAAQKQEELENEGEATNITSILNSTINGVSEAFFERYTGKIGRSALKSFVGKKEAAEQFSGNMLKTILKDTGMEASTEFATSFVQDLSDKLVQGKDISLLQISKNAVDGAIIGAAMGGSISTPKALNGYIAKKSMSKEKQAKIDQKTVEAQTIDEQSKLPEVPEELKVVLEEKRDKLVKEVESIQNKEISRVDNMTEEEVREVFETEEKIKSVAEKSLAITENEAISEDVKQSVLQDNIEEYEQLKNRKEYLSKTEFERLSPKDRKPFVEQAKEMFPERAKSDGKIAQEYLEDRAQELYFESKNKPESENEVKEQEVSQPDNQKETNTPESIQEEAAAPEEAVEEFTLVESDMPDGGKLISAERVDEDGSKVNIGTIGLKKEDGKTIVKLSSLNPEVKKGEGTGTKIYKKVIEDTASKGEVIYSDHRRSEASEGVWKKLEKEGLVEKVDQVEGEESYRYRSILPIQESESPQEAGKETSKEELSQLNQEDRTKYQELENEAIDAIYRNPERAAEINNEITAIRDKYGLDDQVLKHGTPHDFDKFETEKIGTGEGNQAFGWGLYFTESNRIAEGYAKKLSEDKEGNIYEVKVKGGNRNNWLEWRESIEDSYAEDIDNALTKSDRKKYEQYLDNTQDEKEYSGAVELFISGENTKPISAGGLYNDLSEALGQKRASEIMIEAGIDGVKYKSNAGKGEDFNYVVFNPETIEITKKSKTQPNNNKPLPEPKEVQVGKGTFTVETDQDGNQKVFTKDGREVQEFTTRKKKNPKKGEPKEVKVRNANYSRIIAKANNEKTENQINEEEKKILNKALDSYNGKDAEAIAIKEFINGARVNRAAVETIIKEKGGKSLWATGMAKEKNLPSIKGLAHTMWEKYGEETGLEDTDFRDAIEGILKDFSSVTEMKEQFLDIYNQENAKIEQQQMAAAMSSLNPEQIAILEAERFDESIDELSDAEKIILYKDEFKKSIQSLSEQEQEQYYQSFNQTESEGVQPKTPSDATSNEGNTGREAGKKVAKQFYKETTWDYKTKKDVTEEVTVYHGTGDNFNEFDSSKSSEATRYGKGIAFTDGKGIATRYSVARQGYEDDAKYDEKAIVKKAKLTIEKPFDERNVDLKTQEAKNLIGILGERYGFSEELSKNILSGNTGNNRHTPFQILSKAIFDEKKDESTFMFVGNTEKTRKLLEEAGYDSIIGTYEDANEYFVFDAKNVVSIGEKSNDAQPVNSEINISKSLNLEGMVNQLDKLSNELDKFGKENLGLNLPVAVAKVAVDAMRLATLSVKTTADVLSAGLNAVMQTKWFKQLNKSQQKDIEENFEKYLNKPFGNEDKTRAEIESEIDEYITEGKSEKEILESFETRREKMIAKDYLTRAKDVSETEARKIVEDSYKKAEEVVNGTKPVRDRLNKAFGKFMAKTFDRQYLPKRLLLKAGGKIVRNYIIAAKGASGYAKRMYDAAYDKIYKGLSSEDVKTMNKLIQVRRFIAIDENRRAQNKPDVVHPDFINEKIGKAYLEDLKKELGDKKFKDLQKRADAYFDEFRGLLDKMYESGIISKQSRDQFFDIDYQPRQFLQFLKDSEGEISVFNSGDQKSSSGLNQDQIKKLEDGLDSSLIYDSQYLLSRSINVRAKTIAMNNTNNKLVEFMRDQKSKIDKLKEKDNLSKQEKEQIKYFNQLSKRVKDNPIIILKDGKPQYLYNKIPDGFKQAVYYKQGVKHSVLMEEKFFDQYFDVAGGIFSNPNVKETVALASGTGLVKSLATGNNPTFFISNTPRDLLFIATFSDEYGKNVALNLAKITKDAYKGIKDIRKGNDSFKNYVKYGGMMDFLHQQGEFKGTNSMNNFLRKSIDNKWRDRAKNVFNKLTLDKMQMYSEIGFRMAVFNRSIKNQLKEMGLKDINQVSDQSAVDDIYTNAVASARSLTDFNQGGTITKDLDAFIPYLNAASQGTRVMFDNLRDRPAETTFRITQTAAMLTAIPAAASIALISALRPDNEPEEDKELTGTELYLKALGGISKYERSNYMLIFTGGRTENGEFDYYRIAKTHQLTPFFTLAESIQRESMKKMVGDQSESTLIEDMDFVLNNNILPLEMSISGNAAKVPIIKASMTYATGYDFFREQDLSYLRGEVPVVVEGFESSAVEDFYKRFGEEANVSPARFKGAVESFITSPSTTPYVGMLYGGLDAMASDKEGKEIMDKLGKDLLKSTKRRLKKETSEFNRRISNNENMKREMEKVEIESIKTKQKFTELAKKYAAGEIKITEVEKELENVYQDSPFEAKRMVNKFKDVIKNKGVSPYVFEVKYAKPKQRAMMLVQLFGSDLMNDADIRQDKDRLRTQMFQYKAVNQETLVEYKKLIEESE